MKNKKTKQPPAKWTRLVTYPIAGLPYYGYDPKKVKQHDGIRHYHERSNKFDSRAIAVKLSGTMLGHVPRELTYLLHSAKARGCRFRAFINQHFPANPSHRMVYVAVDIAEPKPVAVSHMEF